MTIPHRYFEMMLLKAESRLHREGWDQPPFLATIEMPTDNVIGLVELPIAILNPPGGFIDFLGQRMVEEPDAGSMIAANAPHFKGVAYCCEAWMKTENSAEDVQALHQSGKSLADLVGSVEVRVLAAVDLYGRMYQIMRERGSKPYAMNTEQTSAMVGGRVFRGLHMMALAVARALPDNQQYLDALEPLLVDSIEDMVARDRVRKSTPGSTVLE